MRSALRCLAKDPGAAMGLLVEMESRRFVARTLVSAASTLVSTLPRQRKNTWPYFSLLPGFYGTPTIPAGCHPEFCGPDTLPAAMYITWSPKNPAETPGLESVSGYCR